MNLFVPLGQDHLLGPQESVIRLEDLDDRGLVSGAHGRVPALPAHRQLPGARVHVAHRVLHVIPPGTNRSQAKREQALSTGQLGGGGGKGK